MEVQNDWGRLKSGAGWIYLGNPEYCTIMNSVSSPPEGTTPAKPQKEEKVAGFQASSLKGKSEADIVKQMGPYFTEDQKKTGVLASLSAAQFILESGYGQSELAQNANNCFGMKKSLSGNTWEGSTWDGKSVYTKKAQEQEADGSYITITADFRKYPDIEKSIADHSAYLLGAKNGSALRYQGLKGCTDYKEAAQIVKDGDYATDQNYVSKLCNIVEKWNLTQFDGKAETSTQPTPTPKPTPSENVPYLVKITADVLNIRSGPGIANSRVGSISDHGVYTIVAESSGKGATLWGKLKSGAGWISLDYTKKL